VDGETLLLINIGNDIYPAPHCVEGNLKQGEVARTSATAG